MKKLNDYLNKCTKHLFYSEVNNHYFKISKKEDGNYLVTYYDEEFNFTKEKTIDVERWARVSPNGKEYIDTELKNWELFRTETNYKGEKKTTKSVRQNKHILEQLKKERV